MEFNIISKAFEQGVMPIIQDGLCMIAEISTAQGVYAIARGDRKTGIDKIKYAVTGYVMIKFVPQLFDFVDKVVANATNAM